MVIIVILQVGRNEIGGPQFCPLVHPKTSTGGVTQALNYVGNSRLQNGTSRVARDRFQGQAMVFIACPMNRWSITLEVRFQFRAIFAHLGNGSSLCALRDGVSIDTTMGLTATGNVLNGIELLVFTGGIGEHSEYVRSVSTRGPDRLGPLGRQDTNHSRQGESSRWHATAAE
jgi:acetate kinase